MAGKVQNAILRKLVSQWTQVQAQLARLNNSASALPQDGYAIFHPADSSAVDSVSFDLSPVVLNLPERASDSELELFVVLKGRITFDRSDFCDDRPLRTRNFGTEIGYFRVDGNRLDHILGAHYDYSEDELGHPAFHAQLRSYASEFRPHIVAQLGIQFEAGEDKISGILKTARLPTAQMDLFSTILQLFADHLLYAGSSVDERRAFNRLLDKNRFCQGAAHRIPRLGSEQACECYRALHWYPVLE